MHGLRKSVVRSRRKTTDQARSAGFLGRQQHYSFGYESKLLTARGMGFLLPIDRLRLNLLT